jgi:NTE family protein
MKYLILGPGAMGYFSLLGYLKSIEDKLDEVEEISGASAGSILGLFLATGLSVDEIREFSFNINVPEFVKINLGCFFNKFGFVDIDLVRSKFIEVCKGNPKFKELKKKLYVSAFCLNTSKTEYFSVDTHPDMYVIDAVCMSMSIPFIFSATTYNDKTYVDGGLIEKLPYTPFLNKKPCHVHGVVLKTYTNYINKIDTPIDFLQCVITGALKNREDYTHNIKKTEIDIGDTNVFDFEMSDEQKLKLYFIGLNNISGYIYGEH